MMKAKAMKSNSLPPASRSRSSAELRVCCMAGFPTCEPYVHQRPADLEAGDTAGLETWATRGMGALSRCAILCLIGLAVLVLAGFSAHAQSEQDLIAILQSNSGAVEKAEACRKLRLAGTAKSVPALAALLSEERVSQAARYALEIVPAPEAGAALREAVSRTSGLLKAGVVDSLGWRRDPEAVPLLTPLLSDADATIASTVASALGRIGGRDALAALKAVRDKVPTTVRPVVLESLMRGAEQLLAEGRTAEARAIYQSLFVPAEEESVRVAAYAGMIRSAGDGGLVLVKSALEGNDSAAQTAALQLGGSIQNPDATKIFVALLPRSSPALQIALLALLQQSDDSTAQPAVLTAARGSDAAVRAAAITALGELGDATAVPLLAEAATSRDAAEQTAAREALVILHRGDIAAALVAQLSTATPDIQLELVRALSARSEKSAVSALLGLARSEQTATRKAALQALSRLTDGSHLDALVRLLADAKDNAARDEVRGVFESLAERGIDKQKLDFDPIVRGLASGEIESRKALLQVSVLFVNERLRAALRGALNDSDERIRGAAARALCQARDVALLPDLLEVARQTSEAGLRSLALEGSVRLATEESVSLSTSQRADALAAAFGLASRPEDRQMVLSGLARVPCRKTLDLAEQGCADPAVRAEAEVACLQIAQKLGVAEFEAMEATLTRLAAGAGNVSVKTNAQVLLQKLNSNKIKP